MSARRPFSGKLTSWSAGGILYIFGWFLTSVADVTCPITGPAEKDSSQRNGSCNYQAITKT